MAIPATQLRPGMIIKHNNDLHAVFSVEHRTPGNLRGFVQAKMRNLRSGAIFERTFGHGLPILPTSGGTPLCGFICTVESGKNR